MLSNLLLESSCRLLYRFDVCCFFVYADGCPAFGEQLAKACYQFSSKAIPYVLTGCTIQKEDSTGVAQVAIVVESPSEPRLPVQPSFFNVTSFRIRRCDVLHFLSFHNLLKVTLVWHK